MQQDFQMPFLQPFVRLAQANMSLYVSTYLPSLAGPAAVSPVAANPMQANVHFLHGLAQNYVEFLTNLNKGSLPMFAGTRATLATLAQEL
jgi:hypothetical protein